MGVMSVSQRAEGATAKADWQIDTALELVHTSAFAGGFPAGTRRARGEHAAFSRLFAVGLRYNAAVTPCSCSARKPMAKTNEVCNYFNKSYL